MIDIPWFPRLKISARHAFAQVAMHSHYPSWAKREPAPRTGSRAARDGLYRVAKGWLSDGQSAAVGLNASRGREGLRGKARPWPQKKALWKQLRSSRLTPRRCALHSENEEHDRQSKERDGGVRDSGELASLRAVQWPEGSTLQVEGRGPASSADREKPSPELGGGIFPRRAKLRYRFRQAC